MTNPIRETRRRPNWLSSPAWAGISGLFTVATLVFSVWTWVAPHDSPVQIHLNVPRSAARDAGGDGGHHDLPSPSTSPVLPTPTPTPMVAGEIAAGVTLKIEDVGPCCEGFDIYINGSNTRNSAFDISYNVSNVVVEDNTGHVYGLGGSGAVTTEIPADSTSVYVTAISVDEEVQAAATVMSVTFPVISGEDDVTLSYSLR